MIKLRPLTKVAIFSTLFLSATLAFANWQSYDPELNSLCKKSKGPFSSVLLTSPELKCSNVIPYANLVHKLNTWIPPQTTIPSVALVLNPYGKSASFNNYALNVPLHLGSKTTTQNSKAFSISISRGVAAHEYGHAMLSFILASQNSLDREVFQQNRHVGHYMTVDTAIRTKLNSELNSLKNQFISQLGLMGSWNSFQFAQYQHEVSQIENTYKKDIDDLNFIISDYQSSTNNVLYLARNQILNPYHEFFADLVAVLDSNSWTITRDIIQTIAPKEKTIERDFTDTRNDINKLKSNPDNLNAHNMLGPARFELYKRLKSENCLTPNPKILLKIVSDVISSQSTSSSGNNFSLIKSGDDKRAFNQHFINSIFSKLNQSRQSYCK